MSEIYPTYTEVQTRINVLRRLHGRLSICSLIGGGILTTAGVNINKPIITLIGLSFLTESVASYFIHEQLSDQAEEFAPFAELEQP